MFLYNNSNIIDHKIFTELNKIVQSDGLILLEFNKNNQELITPKNLLKLNIKHNTKQETITLQLQNILNPNKIETVDSKIHNFSILTTKRQDKIGLKRKMQKIIDEFRIEGLQSFDQYTKINPINIQITESEIQNKLSAYSKQYKYKFIINILLFSSSIQNDTNIFIAAGGLKDAKEALINGKMYQVIGVINISQISGWENIKKTSH